MRGQLRADLPTGTQKRFQKPLESMSLEELSKLGAEMGEVVSDLSTRLEEAKKADPFWFYQPSDGHLTPDGHQLLTDFLKPEDIPKQLDGQTHVHASKAGIVLVLGGNQSSKTTTGTINDLIKACGVVPPSLEGIANHRVSKKKVNRLRVICEDYTHGVLNHNLPTIRHWVPREWLIDQRWEKSWSDKRQILMLVHPDRKEICAEVEFMTNQAEVETFQGPPIDRVRYDEQPKKKIHDENLARFMTTELDMEFDMTPTEGITWVHDDLYTEERAPEGASVESFMLCSATNPKANLKTVREILKNIRDYDMIRMRLLGAWVSLSGLIYGGYFKKRLNVVAPEKLGLTRDSYLNCSCPHVRNNRSGNPALSSHVKGCKYPHWLAMLGLDPHQVKATAGTVLCLDRNGTHVLDTCYHQEKDMKQVAAEVKELVRWYRYAWGRCDPHCDSDVTAFNNQNIWNDLKRGVPRLEKANAYKGSIMDGVDVIRQLLLPNTITHESQLVIVDRPENQLLIRSMQSLERETWANEDARGPKEKVLEGRHDHHASMRYIFQRRMKWRPFERASSPSFAFPDMEAAF